jgi:RNA polymerase sigma-32 factor
MSQSAASPGAPGTILAAGGARVSVNRRRCFGVVAPPLPRATECALARRWKEGDMAAGEVVVAACLPFVVSIALEYRKWRVPLDDLVQEGTVGLLLAAKRFDPARGFRLTTYSVHWIRAQIRLYLMRTFRLVRLGTTREERRALRIYWTTGERDPERLAHASGLSGDRARSLVPVLAAREASLSASAHPSGSSHDSIAATDPSPEDAASERSTNQHVRSAVARALESLSARERLIVRERMMCDEPVSLSSLGRRLGVSRERVRQLEARARSKLRGELAELAAFVA